MQSRASHTYFTTTVCCFFASSYVLHVVSKRYTAIQIHNCTDPLVVTAGCSNLEVPWMAITIIDTTIIDTRLFGCIHVHCVLAAWAS